MIRRAVFLAATAAWALRLLLDPVRSAHGLSAMTLAVAEAGMRWRVTAGWAMCAAGALIGLAAAARGASPGWIWGSLGGAVVTAWMVNVRAARFKAEMDHWEGALREVEGRGALLERERGRKNALLREQEASIQELSAMYQLSKQFLGTLDREEGLRIAREFLGKALPSLSEADLEGHGGVIQGMVDRGEVSAEALIQAIPLRGTVSADRERWGILSNQLALGLQRISLYRQVQESASHDGLTGLMVRRYFQERLAGEVEGALRRGSSVAFLMVDLDRFKGVNDSYGHLVGDVVLREIARIIRGAVREMDLVGRYGGEEFAVALPDADEETGMQIAERIRAAVQDAAIRAYDEEVRITVSVGLALCPKHAAAPGQLVEQADRAMYRAKGLGRNRTVTA